MTREKERKKGRDETKQTICPGSKVIRPSDFLISERKAAHREQLPVNHIFLLFELMITVRVIGGGRRVSNRAEKALQMMRDGRGGGGGG